VNAFRSLSDYEDFVYTTPQRSSLIRSSTLVVARRGAHIATVSGEVSFEEGYRLIVRERLADDSGMVTIIQYGYEVWRGDQRMYWYDSQPHPDDLALAATHPHHKHIPPDMKHNRVVAPALRFDQPNLPVLIAEIEAAIRLE
jgi:hypothetical protein